MHEMATARRLVAEALERMGDGDRGDVATVEIVLGSAARLGAEALREHFELAARGTSVEGATVHVVLEASRYWCFDCMLEFSSRALGGGACPHCGGYVISIDRDDLAHVRLVAAGVR